MAEDDGPVQLWLIIPNPTNDPTKERLKGHYQTMPGLEINQRPLWRKINDPVFIFCGEGGQWFIGDEDEMADDFACDTGLLASSSCHDGRWPHEIKHWMFYDETTESWSSAPGTRFVDRKPTADDDKIALGKCEVECERVVDIFTPTQAEVRKGWDHYRKQLAGWERKINGRLPLSPFSCSDIMRHDIGGAGTFCYFAVLQAFSRVGLLIVLVTFPLCYMVCSSSYLANTKGVPIESSFANFVLRTSVANLERYETNTTDFMSDAFLKRMDGERLAFLASLMDAVAVFMVYLMLRWFDGALLPHIIKAKLNAESFALFVKRIPRRLKRGIPQHAYKAWLARHFELHLRAELDGMVPSKVPVGTLVCAKNSEGRVQEGSGSCFCCCPGRAPRGDMAGRRIGRTVSPLSFGKVNVKWSRLRNEKQAPVTMSMSTRELYDLNVLHRLEAAGFGYDHINDENLFVAGVQLVWDFGGKLADTIAATNERARQMEALTARSARSKKKSSCLGALADRCEDRCRRADRLQSDQPIDERDVLGAIVIFTHRKYRDFLYHEYRFSRSMSRKLMDPRLRFEGRAIKVEEAPKPRDIFWENMDTGPWNKRFRMTIVFFLAFVLLAVCAIILAQLKGANERSGGSDLTGKMMCQNVTIAANSTTLTTFVADIANNVKTIGKNSTVVCKPSFSPMRDFDQYADFVRSFAIVVMNFTMGRVVVMLMDVIKSSSLSRRNSHIVGILALLQVLNIGVILILIRANCGRPKICPAGTFEDVTFEWVSDVGSTLVGGVVGTGLFLPMAAFTAVIRKWVMVKLFAKRKKLRTDFYKCFRPPEFPIAKLHAGIITVLSTSIFLAPAFPLMWPFMVVFSFLMLWSGKYELFRASITPPTFTHHMAIRMLRFLHVSILAHLLFAICVYGANDLTASLWDPKASTEATMPVTRVWTDPFFILRQRSRRLNTWPHFFVLGFISVDYAMFFVFFFNGLLSTTVSQLCLYCAMRVNRLRDANKLHATVDVEVDRMEWWYFLIAPVLLGVDTMKEKVNEISETTYKELTLRHPSQNYNLAADPRYAAFFAAQPSREKTTTWSRDNENKDTE